MSVNFEWFNPKVGTPIVSLASYGITFSKSAVQLMGTPDYVMLGFNRTGRIVGVKICDKTEERKIPFAEKMRNGYVRLNAKDFIRHIISSTGCEHDFGKEVTRYIGTWLQDEKLMLIDLNKPLHKGEVEDESEQTENKDKNV